MSPSLSVVQPPPPQSCPFPRKEKSSLCQKSESRYTLLYSTPPPVRNFVFAPFGRMMRTADPSSIALRRVDSTAEGGPRPSLRGVPSSTLLAEERIFHPLARPPRRQRLFPSGQCEEFVSAKLQFPILISQGPSPPFLHPYRPRTLHPSSSSARLSSSAPAVPAM
jgi:hypothetical protein